MTDNLKPCPFCGSSMVDINVDGGYRWCECGNNDCRASAKAFWFLRDAGNADHIVANNWNTRPIEDALRAQLAEAQAEVDRLTVQLEEAGKALSGLGYTPSADDSGSYDSLIPDKYL